MTESLSYEIVKGFGVPVSDLFQAMLDGNILKQLWGLNDFRILSEDPRKAYAEMVVGEENWSFELAYDSIIKDEYLSWRVRFDRAPHKEIVVCIKFSGTSDSGSMTVQQSNFDSQEESDANEIAWRSSLEKLEEILIR